MVVDGVVDERVPHVGAAVDFAGSRGLAVGAGVTGALGAAVDAMSAPSGIHPSFLMSTWIKSPDVRRSYRRTTRWLV